MQVKGNKRCILLDQQNNKYQQKQLIQYEYHSLSHFSEDHE